ncbi:MAG: hypothetical protein FJW56_03555, partial [Actinobacteria bacterium]|nr:hypothetical protein [Actinomycetota bacterium]
MEILKEYPVGQDAVKVTNIFKNVLQGTLNSSEDARLELFQNMRTFYDGDYEGIVDILKDDLLNKPFSQKTLSETRFLHIDVIQKVLNRLTAGIYDKKPIRQLFVDGKPYNELEEILDYIDFHQKVKEALRKALFFNLCLVQPIVRENEFELDNITGDEFVVTSRKNYLKIKDIILARSDGQTIYKIFWSDDKHYLIGDYGQETPVEGNRSMVNPYRELPFSVLRIKEGMDFFGEPNQSLYNIQKALDVKLTNLDITEIQQHFGVWFGVNTNFPQDVKFSPGILHQVNGLPSEDVPPRLENIVPNIDWSSLKNNIDWIVDLVLEMEGIADSKSVTGVARKIDELEIEERKQGVKTNLKKFEVNLLNKIRVVWNYHARELGKKPIPKG